MNHKPVVGVGAVIIKEDKVLLVKRARMPYAGLWCIPGGKVHFGESLQKAAEREILEETSLVIKAGDPIYVFEAIETGLPALAHHYVVVDLRADYVSGEPVARDDALEVAWFSRADIRRDDVHEQTRACLQKCWELTNFSSSL